MGKLALIFLILPALVLLGCVQLSPEESVNPVGNQHTVTATFVDGSGDPIAGLDVVFEVISGPNAGETGTGTTDANGQATFTYTSNGQPGEDVIEVCEDAATPVLCTTAIKHWALLLKFGDADCNGTMTVTDAIKLQQTIAGIPVTQIEPCPDIESDVSVLIGSVD